MSATQDLFGFVGVNASETKAVFAADLNTDNRFDLYTANADGTGSQVQISTNNLSNFAFTGAKLTPNGNRVLYQGAFAIAGRSELFSASTSATDDTTQVKLQPLLTSDHIILGNTVVTPDSSRVVYAARLGTSATTPIDIYSTPTDSSAPIKVSSSPGVGLNANASSIRLTSDSSRVVYVGDLTTDTVNGLYSASTTSTSTQIQLDTPMVGGTVSTQIALTSDGLQVVYYGDLTTDGTNDLYIASTSLAGTQTALTSLTATGLSLTGTPVISPNDLFVAYTTLGAGNNRQLWYTALDNSITPVQLTPGSATWTTEINQLTWMPDSSGLLFRGDFGVDNQENLYYAAVPEPSDGILLTAAVLVLVAILRRRRRQAMKCQAA